MLGKISCRLIGRMVATHDLEKQLHDPRMAMAGNANWESILKRVSFCSLTKCDCQLVSAIASASVTIRHAV